MQRKPRLEKLSSDLFTTLSTENLGQAGGAASIVLQYPFTGTVSGPHDVLNDINPGRLGP